MAEREPAPEVEDSLALALATLGKLGKLGPAPGTIGSVVAVILAPGFFLPLPLWGRGLLLAALFLVGGWAAGRAEVVLGRKDPPQVIIDELLGQWLAFLPFAALSWWELAAGLAAFRLFDITKPGPIRRSENWLPGGFGTMIDDVLAGVAAMAVLALVVWREQLLSLF